MNSTGANSSSAQSVDPQTWDQVLESVAPEHQFLSHHWYDVWSRTYAVNDEVMQPVVYSSTVTTTELPYEKENLFPCVIRSQSGIQILSTAGYYYPFRTFLCHPDVKETALDHFVDVVHDETTATIFQVGPLQVSDQIRGPLRASFQRKNWRLCEVSAGAQQVVNLPATVDEFRASLSRNLRKNHDRRKRALAAMGQFDIYYYNNCTADDWDKVIDQCAEVEAHSWLATDKDGKTRVYGRESFWKSYAAHIDGSRRLSVWVVSLDAKPIAYSLDKKHGVGIIADMSMFEQALEAGIKVVNMGDGESDYKRRWGAEPSEELQSLYFFRPGAIGWLGHNAFRTLDRLRHSKLFYRLNRYF